MDAKLQVKKVNVFYGSNHALKDINISIPSNQITVILGPSGCGKTTLLKTFNRFLEINETTRMSGKVLFNGKNIYDRDIDVIDIRKKIGLLAQRPYPLPMSIYDNVAYGIRIHQLKKGKDIPVAVRSHLKQAGLWDEVSKRLHEPAVTLSIGQQQRLCLARGLAVEPEVILCDEPTSALDPISAQHIEKRLIKLKSAYTTVLVTHILRQAKRLADYVIFMYLGEVVEAGPASQVFLNPKEERTKAYLAGVI